METRIFYVRVLKAYLKLYQRKIYGPKKNLFITTQKDKNKDMHSSSEDSRRARHSWDMPTSQYFRSSSQEHLVFEASLGCLSSKTVSKKS